MSPRLLALLLVVLLLTACQTAVDQPAPEAAPAPQAAPAPTAAGPLDVPVNDLDGQPVDLAALAGQDLALWFWAPW
jgi:hypothetical protein